MHASNAGGDSSESTASNTVTPAPKPTLTFVSPTPNVVSFGTSSTVAATSNAAGGTISYGSSTPLVCTITAAGAVTYLTAGTCTATADQVATAAHPPATQATHNITVNAVQPGPPTNFVAAAGNGSATLTFTAPTNTGGAPITGYTVTVNPGNTTQACAASGCAIALSNGTLYTLTLKTNSAAGSSATGPTATVRPGVTAQSITFAQPATQTFGSSPTLTATASSGLAVSFTSSTTNICTITAAGTLTTVAVGSCTINADQSGDATRQSAPTVSRTFAIQPATPTLTVTSTVNPSVVGQPVTFTAALTNPVTTTGTVQWAVNGANVGSPVTITPTGAGAGTATFTPSPTLALGSSVVKATYAPAAGDANHQAASGQLTQVVGRASTKTTVSVSGDTITATVGPVAPGAGTPTGTVTFTVGGVAAGSGPLDGNGVATVTATGVGNKAVAASYGGDANFLASSGNRAAIGPTVVPHISSAHRKHNGWYRSAVEVSFTCTANTAPVVSCPAPQTRSANGAAQSVTVTVKGTDGGTTTVSVSPINIDRVAPTLTIRQVGHKVRCRAHDALSGGATCTMSRRSEIANGVKTVHWKAVAHDRAGNRAVKRGHFSFTVG